MYDIYCDNSYVVVSVPYIYIKSIYIYKLDYYVLFSALDIN